MKNIVNNIPLTEKGFLIFSGMCISSITLIACCSNKSIKIGNLSITDSNDNCGQLSNYN